MRVVAGGAEGVRGHRRARADAAVEDHRALAVDRRRGRAERGELDVARARDVPGVALVVLAHVDEQRAGRLELGGARGA